MQHFPHPDEEMFAHYAGLALSGLTACMGEPTPISGEKLLENLPEIAALLGDKMVELHRKRFPLPTVEEMDAPPGWDPRFGKFPHAIFEGLSDVDLFVMDRPFGRPTSSKTLREQMMGRGLRRDFSFADSPAGQYRGTLDDFVRLLALFGVDKVPQWVADVANESTFLSPEKKQQVYDHLSTMLQGKRVNLTSGSIKGAFDWKDAPGGLDFWTDISQSIPVVPDDVPAKILPDDGKKVKPEHPPLRAFALALMAVAPTTPGELKHAWFEHQKATGKTFRRYFPCASRDAFGATSAAYQCLYKLEKLGLIQRTKESRETRHWDQYELVPVEPEPSCGGNCGMNYCDENGCIERKRHYVPGMEPGEAVCVANNPAQ